MEHILTIEDRKFTQYKIHGDSGYSFNCNTPQKFYCSLPGGWKVGLIDNAERTNGRIIVLRESEEGTILDQSSFPMSDGVLTLNDNTETPAIFEPRSVEEIFLKRFGITHICRRTPNRTLKGFWRSRGRNRLTNIATDGEYFCNGVTGTYNIISALEDHHGPVKYQIKDSTWTVLCVSKTKRYDEQTIVLFTEAENLYYLADHLQTYLDENRRDDFRGINEFYSIKELSYLLDPYNLTESNPPTK